MENGGKRSAPLKVCFWCFCPRTGEKRFGCRQTLSAQTLFVDGRLHEGDNLEIIIRELLDTENAELDFVLNVDYFNGFDSTGWLVRTHYAYCQIDLSKYAIEREHRDLPALEFFDIELIKSRGGLLNCRHVDLALLGELRLIEQFPPTV